MADIGRVGRRGVVKMDYIGSAIAIAVFTLVASFWFNGPAVSAEAAPVDSTRLVILR